MSLPAPLPDLDKTVTQLMLELLLISRENRYPDLLYGRPDQKQSVRITMHYVMALLAYGFTPEDEELAPAVPWFDKAFPRRQENRINMNEMNRLMVLLHLAPEKDSVQSRLRQLVNQESEGYYDIQPGWQAFDSLWALEALVLAKRKGVLSEATLSTDKLKDRLAYILSPRELKRDKDRALGLRLWYDLTGSLEDEHLALLDDILTFASENNNMWGMREFTWRIKSGELKWFHALVDERKLTYEMIRDDHPDETDQDNNYRFFRKVIMSTCMVIEALSPLGQQYPHICETLAKGLHPWWQQFKGDQGIATLRELFPKGNDYEYLLVLTRTIRMLREYLGQPLRKLDPVHMLRVLTEIKTNRSETLEMRNLKQVLRNWLKVDIIGAVEQLKLGFSDANVVRVQPYIADPLADADGPKPSLIPTSLVIKSGSEEMIKSERQHYELLPAAIQDCFVRIPETVYTDPESGSSYVVMQDLRHYRTLYEVYEDVASRVDEVGKQLGTFLCRMHEGGSSTRTELAPRSLVRETYLGKMLEYIDRIFTFVQRKETFIDNPTTEEAQTLLFENIGKIIQCQQKLATFPAAYMHGDLHLRNIMVRGLDSAKEGGNLGLTFKLIDLEFLRRDGDAAFDLGQLLVDIDLVAHEAEKQPYFDQLMELCKHIETCYGRLSQGDETFKIRIELAKARALLRIAKGKTKRGYRFMQTDQSQDAQKIAEDVITHALAALDHLKEVTKAIC